MAVDVASFPLELLAAIFSFLCTDKKDHWRSRRAPPSDIVAPSHVCRRWRKASLSSWHLWAAWVPLLSLEWTRVCLDRSRSTLFNVLWDSSFIASSEEYRSAAHLVYPQMTRASTLTIQVKTPWPMSSSETILRELGTAFVPLSAAAQNLSALVVEFSGFHPSITECNGQTLVLHKVITMQKHPPGLLKLSLTRMTVSMSHSRGFFCFNLRKLSLTDSHIWRNVDEMVEMFQSVPMLESFQYRLEAPYRWQNRDGARFIPSRSEKYPLRCVRLPHLKSLILSGDSMFAINITIFSYLALPSNATLHLSQSARSSPARIQDIEDFIQMGRQTLYDHFAFADAHDAHFEALEVGDLVLSATADGPAGRVLSYIGSDESKTRLSRLPHLPRRIQFAIPEIEGEEPLDDDRPQHDRLLGMILDLPAFAGTRCLSVQDTFGSYTASYFRRFPCLTTLVFNDVSRWVLFSGFLRDAIEDGAKPLPMLKRIIVPCASPSGTDGYNLVVRADLKHYEDLADVVLAHFGDYLEVLGISMYDSDWDDGDAVLTMLRDKLGPQRVRIWRADEYQDDAARDEDENSSDDEGQR
ncbi:hypothetical protein PENSPDRAFT_693579 [Peniophora sp. CONT]|nr:hypothetical protein PENSPDRAFT_693579 [Peniophora sp. CONT]